MIYFFLGIQALFFFLLAVQLRNLKKRLSSGHKKAWHISRKNQELLHELGSLLERKYELKRLPLAIADLPFADSQGIVLSTKKVQIPTIVAPYNGSIIEKGDGYLLFFRFDTPTVLGERNPFFSQIGCVELGEGFEVRKDSFFQLDTGSRFSEDARVFQHEGNYFLLYNDLIGEMRGLQIAEFDVKTKQLGKKIPLKVTPLKMEKNWTPFSSEGKIHFLYSFLPQKVLKLEDSLLSHYPTHLDEKYLNFWRERWGELRGGTPARLIDGEYLAFFHSSFEERTGTGWYVMGAYTFAAKPPYQLLRISSYPILFEGIYSAIHHNTAKPHVRSLYPSGFVYKDGKIHVSCGENDSELKIVTMDKKTLLASLIKYVE